MAAADVDGDGRVDLVLANRARSSFSVLIGQGNGTFAAPVDFELGEPADPIALALADLNQDGLLDVVTANVATNDVSVILRTS
jgi:hypothetical protein